MAANDLDGVSIPRIVSENAPLPAGAQVDTYKLPTDFNVCYMLLSFTMQGDATDAPTLAEQLTKVGTIEVRTNNGLGQWLSALDADDLYYKTLQSLLQGAVPAIVGEGGGIDDLTSQVKILIDAGCGAKISSRCAWKPEQKAEIRINYAADAGLDTSEINIRYVGYEGTPPAYVASLQNREVTPVSGGEVEMKAKAGDMLSEFWGFITTDLDLATLQAYDAASIAKLRVMSSKTQMSEFDVWGMVDKLDNSDDANILQYIFLDLDYAKQGIGHVMPPDPMIVALAGTAADAVRLYAKVLEPHV